MNVLVIAAHPDDETLGVGGTIAKHISNGDKVSVVTFTDGVSSRSHEKRKEENRRIRVQELEATSKVLGFTGIHYEFPDQELDTISLLKLSKVIGDAQVKLEFFQPNIVYTHYAHDLNQDHKQLYYATLIAFRPKPGQTCKEIYCYRVPSLDNSGIPFNPTYFVELSEDNLEKKRQVWKCYESEHDNYLRSVANITMCATICGLSVGLKYAESFEIVRIIR